jgi:hypothetical protein
VAASARRVSGTTSACLVVDAAGASAEGKRSESKDGATVHQRRV